MDNNRGVPQGLAATPAALGSKTLGMPRLLRQPSFQITDQPEDSYDAASQFPDLDPDAVATEFEKTDLLDDEGTADSRHSRRRVAVAIALAFATATTTTLLARDPSTTPPPRPANNEPPAPVPQTRTPAPHSQPAATARPRLKNRPRSTSNTKTRVTHSTAPAPGYQPRAATKSEPAGGEFILGAR